MKRSIILLIMIYTWVRSSPIVAQQIPGSVRDAVSAPASRVPSDLPPTWQKKIRNILESDPEKKKAVDNFLEKQGLPKSNKITDEEVNALVNKINDPRGQPVDPSEAGPILKQAWAAIHPTEPVPIEILDMVKETICSGAASSLIALRAELHAGPGTSPFDPSNLPDKQAIASAIKILDGYLDACLQRAGNVGEIGGWLDNVVGVLRYENSETESCIATLIGPKHLLTARHCIFEFSGGGWYPLSWRSLDFILPSRETERRRVVSIVEPAGTVPDVFLDTSDDSDWIIMILDAPALTVEAPRLEGIQALDKLILYSKQPLVYQRDKLADTIGAAKIAPALADQVRVDRSESCRSLFISSSGCVTHGCQSEGGVSGAPLFRFSADGKKLSLVAIHQGEVSPAYAGTCLPANQPRLPNRGRAMTSGLITAIRNTINTP